MLDPPLPITGEGMNGVHSSVGWGWDEWGWPLSPKGAAVAVGNEEIIFKFIYSLFFM
jgi:hypothetical protein